MIDTLNINIPIKYVKKEDIENVKTIMAITDEGRSLKYGNSYVRGTIENYQIVIRNNNRIELRGSLCKFFKGSNLDTLRIDEIIPALKVLSSRTGLPVLKGIIKRIDIVDNFIMEKPIQQYLDCLEYTPGYHLQIYPGTKTFPKPHNLSICFYDKVREMKLGRNNIEYGISNLIGVNIFRIELRLEQKLNRTLNVKMAHVALLFQKKICNTLLLRWIERYEEINKSIKFGFDNNTSSLPEFKHEVSLFGIEKLGGRDKVFKMVDQLRKMGKWDNKKVKRAKDWIREIYKSAKRVHEMDLIRELNEKINEASIFKDVIEEILIEKSEKDH